MSKHIFQLQFHQQVQQVLRLLDEKFLVTTSCYFGGGTRIVLDLGEYRESRDVVFLCASHDGYRLLRESITEQSLGAIALEPIKLAREVRSDQYGIRTFIESPNGTKVKFEIVREARIQLSTSPGEAIKGVRVPVLSRVDAFAEKFLANADRGLDAATNSRDIVDLAFMIQGWGHDEAKQGWLVANEAYGSAINRALTAVTSKIKTDVAYRKKCFEALRVTETKYCIAGIDLLASQKWRGAK
jgi:hypothetical protein